MHRVFYNLPFDQCGFILYNGDVQKAIVCTEKKDDEYLRLGVNVFSTDGGDRSMRDIGAALGRIFYRVMAVFAELQPFFSAFSILTAILVINRPVDPAYKIGWVLVILGAPIIGIPLYILAGNRHGFYMRSNIQSDEILDKKKMASA